MLICSTINWDNIFEEKYKKEGATEEEINTFLNTWNKDLLKDEIAEINDEYKIQNPQAKITPFEKDEIDEALLWKFPKRNLSQTYIQFLQYSNGGSFRNGERWFDSFYTIKELRKIMLISNIPKYMEYAVPFSSDGSGNYYVFDMRQSSIENEYPILAVDGGNLEYDDCKLIGMSFLDVCIGKISLDTILSA